MTRPTQPLPKGTYVRLDRATGELQAREYQISIVGGPDAGRSLLLEGLFTVGTSPQATLQLSDPTISRIHLELGCDSEGVRVRDTGSTNGTFLEGTRITEVLVLRPTVFTLGKTSLKITPVVLPLPVGPEAVRFEGLLGESPALQRLSAALSRIAASDMTTLLVGETGTGKSLIAEALHRASPRRKGPFVAVHCEGLSPALAESELFGHVQGAFTGATRDRAGVFERAHQGTVYFDDISRLPMDLQPKLLRALEEHTVRPVGSNQELALDVRVVASAQAPLEEAVARGTFRQDLYFRVAVALLQVPPLRERKMDIGILARHFAEASGAENRPLPEDLLSLWMKHDWPGNVRELRNSVARWVLGEDPLPAASRPSKRLGARLKEAPFKEAKEQVVARFEREYLASLMERHQGNVSAAAEEAGLARTYLYALLKKLGLSE